MSCQYSFEHRQREYLHAAQHAHREICCLREAISHGTSVGKGRTILRKPVDIILSECERALNESSTALRVFLFHKTGVDHTVSHHNERIIVILVPAVPIVVPASGVVVSVNAVQSLLQPLLIIRSPGFIKSHIGHDAEELPVAGAALMTVDLPQPLHQIVFSSL